MTYTWAKADVVQIFDSYIFNLRLLARGSGLQQGDFSLPEAWSLSRRGSRCLYLFEVAGIKASGYPEMLNQTEPTGYATTAMFMEFLSGVLKSHGDDALLGDWQSVLEDVIAVDPRFVAFRTAFDWLVLHAKILTECAPAGNNQVSDFSNRTHDPFTRQVPEYSIDEPVGLIAGNPLDLVDTDGCWELNCQAPSWGDVEDKIGAIHYMHRWGSHVRKERPGRPQADDPRLRQLELLTPERFAGFMVTRAVEEPELMKTWRDRPAEEVAHDPRFIAHRCGFDRVMAEIMHSEPRTPVTFSQADYERLEASLAGRLKPAACDETLDLDFEQLTVTLDEDAETS